MSQKPLPKRLAALVSVSAFALSPIGPAWAAPPPIVSRADPPARVGRLSRINGTVSFHTEDAAQWSPATLNYPFTSGDAFWTEAGARLDLQIAANRVTLAPTTELDVTSLDDRTLATSEPQGETYLELRTVPAGDTYVVQTPRGTVQIAAAGRYDIVAGDTDHPTLITVVDGSAQITGNNLSLQVGPRQTASITGTGPFQGSVGPIAQDTFLTAMLAEDRPAPRASVPVPPIVQGMTGCESLETVGNWAETPQYGTVWYPPVEAGWVPYRHGHWSYVAPWGWTWVDDAAWGFAPFHYGRWAQIDNRWGWIPVSPGGYADPVAAYPVPVYAPALVSFVDFGGAALAGAAVGYAASRSVGWVPLGPREAYYPPYHANLNYVRSVNATTIQNVNQTINTTTVNNNRTLVQNFFNRGAATVVPAVAMVQSQPVAAAARPLPPDQFARTQAQFRAPIAPTATTAGITPAVARQFNFLPPARPVQPIPGPAIDPAIMRAAPGHGFPSPALRAGGAAPAAVSAPAPEAARSNEPARPEGASRPAGAPAPDLHTVPDGRPAVPTPEAARPAEPVRPELRPGFQARPDVPRPEQRPAGLTPGLRPANPPQVARQNAPPPRAPVQVPRPQAMGPRPAPPSRPAAPAPVFRAPPPVFHPQAVARPAAPQPRPAGPPPRPAAPAPHPGGRGPEHR